ncbi:hypothetical protein NDU88_007285 [Pleurodeles waltl]|uniref:Uncharacterized protein n=1 Tax=Pleurodeles waltl TaxID=8319 RepID=A0AAV7LSU8_PLEWA|nr:hypothetical protein NDU88_007285 [Pleurodeles waltl]
MAVNGRETNVDPSGSEYDFEPPLLQDLNGEFSFVNEPQARPLQHDDRIDSIPDSDVASEMQSADDLPNAFITQRVSHPQGLELLFGELFKNNHFVIVSSVVKGKDVLHIDIHNSLHCMLYTVEHATIL